ncbi:MAG: hypothetical protein ACD_54C00009G0003 [uncultured bacterium]|nr:MAG: hypothetical protein ACD_54C00009G0003 [uncultured bacterium]
MIELAREFDLHPNQIKQCRDRGVRDCPEGRAGADHRCNDPARIDRRADAEERFFVRRARQSGAAAERKKMIDPTSVQLRFDFAAFSMHLPLNGRGQITERKWFWQESRVWNPSLSF